MKYLEVNYPENLEELFRTSIDPLAYLQIDMPSLSFPTSPADPQPDGRFDGYGISNMT